MEYQPIVPEPSIVAAFTESLSNALPVMFGLMVVLFGVNLAVAILRRIIDDDVMGRRSSAVQPKPKLRAVVVEQPQPVVRSNRYLDYYRAYGFGHTVSAVITDTKQAIGVRRD